MNTGYLSCNKGHSFDHALYFRAPVTLLQVVQTDDYYQMLQILEKRASIFLACASIALRKTGACFAGDISETWLKPQIPEGEVNIPVRQDRIRKSGGGTKIHVEDGIPFHERPDLNTAYFESCIIEVSRTKCKKLFIWIVYRAPDNHLDTFIDGLNSSLPNIPYSAQLRLLGDFNVSYS